MLTVQLYITHIPQHPKHTTTNTVSTEPSTAANDQQLHCAVATTHVSRVSCTQQLHLCKNGRVKFPLVLLLLLLLDGQQHRLLLLSTKTERHARPPSCSSSCCCSGRRGGNGGCASSGTRVATRPTLWLVFAVLAPAAGWCFVWCSFSLHSGCLRVFVALRLGCRAGRKCRKHPAATSRIRSPTTSCDIQRKQSARSQKHVQTTHLHMSEQRTCASKQSQYFFTQRDFLHLQPLACAPTTTC